jgi:hypothetical protein
MNSEQEVEAQILLSADSFAELMHQLQAIDTTVPPRSGGRTKQQVERYSMVHLLGSLPASTWTFPIVAVHGDRPDFTISEPRQTIGIEHVEAVSENQAKSDFLREKGFGPDMHMLQSSIPGEPRKSTSQLLEEMNAEDQGQMWIGNASEKQWAEAMIHFISKKLEVVRRDGFQRHDKNWLLIYDNWRVPALDEAGAGKLLADHHGMQLGLEMFDRIHVIDDQTLWEFSRDGVTIIPRWDR